MGDRVTALRLYKRLETTLERDLGITPEPELVQLEAGIRSRSGGR